MRRDEAGRLAALRRYEILDTDPEKRFDDLSLLAAQICDAPIALLTLVDSDRQWFKARRGLEACQTPREFAFCAHAIEQPDLFIVPDAREDPRFRDNPLVTGDPHIRFYAGAPLIDAEGFALGTLCVIDRRPRQLSDRQLEALEALRNQAISQLELRRNLIELRHALAARDEAEDKQRALVEELEQSFLSVKKLAAMIPLCGACKLDMTIPADAVHIDTVVDGVLEVLETNDWAAGREMEIETALREALANAIKHGCKSDPDKSIQCCVTCDASGEVLIVVRDPGAGFEVSTVPSPTIGNGLLRSSGRGIFLINQLMDEVRHTRGGREIRMRKKAPLEDETPAGDIH